MVSRTSEPCAAISRSSSPFFLPDQPISGTVRKSWPGSSRRKRRGAHSSSRIRMAHQDLLGESQRRHRLLTSHAREVLQELVEGFAGFQVVEQGADGDTGTDEDRSTAEDV